MFEIDSKRQSIPIQQKIPLSDISVNRGSDLIKSLIDEAKDLDFRSEIHEKEPQPIKIKLESTKRKSQDEEQKK